MTECHEITKGLFLGGQWATDPECLRQHQIDSVLNVCGSECDANRGRYPLKRYLTLEISDNAHQAEKMEKEVLPKALAFIDYCRSQKDRVLVHCSAGRSRSATVVAALLIRDNGWYPEEALQFINERRPIQLNKGFAEMLHRDSFEEMLIASRRNLKNL